MHQKYTFNLKINRNNLENLPYFLAKDTICPNQNCAVIIDQKQIFNQPLNLFAQKPRRSISSTQTCKGVLKSSEIKLQSSRNDK